MQCKRSGNAGEGMHDCIEGNSRHKGVTQEESFPGIQDLVGLALL